VNGDDVFAIFITLGTFFGLSLMIIINKLVFEKKGEHCYRKSI
jgi:hypothetical protein